MKLTASRALRDILPFAATIVVLCSFRSAIADWNDVPTGSMNPTIVEGDRILVNKLAFGLRVPFTPWYVAHWSTPQRGDIVIFTSPADGQRLVKRVIGLPGDVVAMTNERLTINGQPAQYAPPPASFAPAVPTSDSLSHVFAMEKISNEGHPMMATPSLPAMRSFGPVTVPADQYLVLGDNRDNSADSRYIGFVPAENIVGRSSRVLLSVDPDDHYLPRWERMLKPLP